MICRCGAQTHRDDTMNARCNSCEWLVRLCRCTPGYEAFKRAAAEPRPYWATGTERDLLIAEIMHHSLDSDGTPRLVLDLGALTSLRFNQLTLLRLNLMTCRHEIAAEYQLWD